MVDYPSNNYISRGNKVYDRAGQSYIFTEDMEVPRLVQLVLYEDTPEVYKQALLAASKVTHFLNNDEGTAKVQELTRKAQTRLFRLKQEDLKKKEVSALNNSYAGRLLGGMSPNHVAGQFGTVVGGHQWLLTR